ncbi:very short patch repair endonuclease [Acidovorax sp.]|uniref:very short patch repair endonuclease n=1 Tax=Acidovorax sp. TaxID=1872122 RepID=UPI003D036D96
MVDVVTPADRSRMMAGIQGKNTKPELTVRQMLFASGYRFRLHRRDLPGAPDIVMPSRKVAIFVHGCFWHMHSGCRFAKLPSTRPEFWQAKLQGNIDRDQAAVLKLNAMGWRVLWVWECATRAKVSQEALPVRLRSWIESDSTFGEIGEKAG